MRSGSTLEVTRGPVSDLDPAAIARFAAHLPLQRADFASIATLMPAEPLMWRVMGDGQVVAAAIDDGLAMTVAGDRDALIELSRHVADLHDKLVIAGRRDDVSAFLGEHAGSRQSRDEHFMTIRRGGLLLAPTHVSLRVATVDDLPLLEQARAAALEEEYGVPVRPGGDLYGELARAVRRAVEMQGVAIWIEDGRVAFTAQLIAKTPDAAMFGDLYTDPQLRGAGRATRALVQFCEWLMTESEHVTLRVGADNHAARRLYDRIGFADVDVYMSSLRADQEIAGAETT